MTEPDRRRLLGMLAVLVVLAAAVAGFVATASQEPPARLRATGPLGADDEAATTTADVPETTAPAPETTTTSVASTTTARPAAPATAAPPTTTTATPTTTTTALPPPTLDVGPETCADRPPERITGAVVGVALPDGLHEVSLDGTRDVLLPNTPTTPPPSPPAWSADGRRLAFVQPSPTRQDSAHYPARDLVVVDLVRGCSRVLAPRGSDSLDQPAWSPDGTALAFVRTVSGSWPGPRTLETARDDGTNVTRIAQGTYVLGASWAPDGSGRIAFGQDGGMRVRHRDGKVIVVDDTTGGAEFQSWSADSTKLVYTVSVHQGVWVAAADGSGYLDASPKGTRNPNGIFWSRFSPDSRRIAFAWNMEAWVVDADGNNARRVTAEKAGAPRWTPAGDELVYDGDGGVRIVPVEGGASRLLHAGSVVTVFQRS
jgi:dipeptidyl aminopeptidase/acylaminoacyl peptidase